MEPYLHAPYTYQPKERVHLHRRHLYKTTRRHHGNLYYHNPFPHTRGAAPPRPHTPIKLKNEFISARAIFTLPDLTAPHTPCVPLGLSTFKPHPPPPPPTDPPTRGSLYLHRHPYSTLTKYPLKSRKPNTDARGLLTTCDSARFVSSPEETHGSAPEMWCT